MLTYDEIISFCSNYRIENGTVIDNKTNEKVTDEDTILKVKSSVLIFKEARSSYQEDMVQFDQTRKSKEDYVKKTMEKFSVNDEENTFGINKLIRAIISSNGHYEEYISGNDLQNGKFSILVEPKKDYGLAYLRLKFREKGLDLESFNISQDLSELKHNGVSKVIIDFKVKQKEKTNIEDKESIYRHPKADILNELEKQKKDAKQMGDEVGYNYALRNIERIVREEPAYVSAEEFNKMSIESKKAFIKVKINEARVLRNKAVFDYWTQNLSKLEQRELDKSEPVHSEPNKVGEKENQPIPVVEVEKRKYQIPVVETNREKEPVQSNPVSQVTPNEERTKKEKHNYKYYFDEMMKVIQRYNPDNATAEEKKQAIGEIYYYMGYMTSSLTNMHEIFDLNFLVINELSDTPFKIKLRDSILKDIIWQKNKITTNTYEKEETKELDSKFSRAMQELRSKLKKIQQSYKNMLQDGSIDEDELNVLLGQMSRIVEDSYSLKRFITTDEAKEDLRIVINELEEQKEKMLRVQRGVEDLKGGLRY